MNVLPHQPPRSQQMIGIDEARQDVIAAFAPLPMVRIPLAEALGSVLAIDVIAGESVPSFPNAAMDGFAVRAAETLGASSERPVRLRVIAEAAAGYESGAVVTPRTAVRIMTGAPAPRCRLGRMRSCVSRRRRRAPVADVVDRAIR